MAENTLDVTEQSVVSDFSPIGQLIDQALQNKTHCKIIEDGIPSGFNLLDKEIQGFKNGTLTTIAVKPGMGKTALMLSITSCLAIKNNYSIALFSAERSKEKIAKRIIESETGMSVININKGALKASESDHLELLLSSIAKANIFICDKEGVTYNEICEKAFALKGSKRIDLVIIDMLELVNIVKHGAGQSEETLKETLQALKNLAKDLNIPVLAFTQYYASGDSGTKAPQVLNNIRKLITDYSDILLLLHRPDVFGSSNGTKIKGSPVEIIVAKNRNNYPNSVVPVKYIESIAKFVDH